MTDTPFLLRYSQKLVSGSPFDDNNTMKNLVWVLLSKTSRSYTNNAIQSLNVNRLLARRKHPVFVAGCDSIGLFEFYLRQKTKQKREGTVSVGWTGRRICYPHQF